MKKVALARILKGARTSSCAAFLLLATAGAEAQYDYVTPEVPAGFWASAYVASGGSSVERRELVMNDYRILLESSIFSQEDHSEYQQDQYRTRGSGPSSAFIMGASIHPFRGDGGRGPELRVGINHIGGSTGQLQLTRNERYRIDTLSSSSSGSVYFVDSVFTQRYLLEYSAERLGLDASLVFRSDQKARWSFFGGGGIGVGGRFNAKTTATYSEESVTNRPGHSGGHYQEQTRYEEVRNSSGLWFMIQAPLGVGFRLAKGDGFMGRMELSLEGRPGMMVQGSKEFGTITSVGSQFLFGLRVRLS